MKEEKITITISPDGRLRAETRGLKGDACDRELAGLLAELAEIHEVEHTVEARERPAGAGVAPVQTTRRR
ncbi:DUF2997 domain-containing protein [Sorangium sp. So ce128]|uniref:DUF2997 domain-containing protein n=1 Tax=Sorangium sp. So ce128 TaxID=3133281 RepID=UPI003F5D6A87